MALGESLEPFDASKGDQMATLIQIKTRPIWRPMNRSVIVISFYPGVE